MIVLNNFGDGMVKQWQKLFHKGRLSASDKSLHTKDFVKAAMADGFKYAVRHVRFLIEPHGIFEAVRHRRLDEILGMQARRWSLRFASKSLSLLTMPSPKLLSTIKVIVLNNFGDGMVKQWQKLFHSGRLSASDKSLHTEDFVKAAMADGFRYAVRLDQKADVPRVIEEFIRFKGPAFLEVMIDRDAGVYPMVGPGQAYSEMITGEHIPSRTQVDIKTPDASEMF